MKRMLTSTLLFAFLPLIGHAPVLACDEDPKPVSKSARAVAGPIAAQYRDAADRIIAATMAGNDAWRKLEELCDDIGHRLSGSPQLNQAVDWAVEAMRRDGQENVRREKVMVPHWVRGAESATMVQPRVEPFLILGLGGSVGTPPEGITGEVLVVEDEAALEASGDAARGKIILVNNAMPAYHPETGSGYGTAVRFRVRGAQLAARKGAIGCLVRSVTAYSLRTPHTGAMSYGDLPEDQRIPAASITVEDADLIARLARRGTPVAVNLKMEAKTLPDAESANFIAELRIGL